MKFSFTKNPKSDFYKKSKSNKKNQEGGRAGGGGVARVDDIFSKEFKSEKNCSWSK